MKNNVLKFGSYGLLVGFIIFFIAALVVSKPKRRTIFQDN